MATILSSGVIAAVISASLTDSKERRVVRRQKIEEIYLGTAAWLTAADSMFLTYLRVADGRLTYNQALDLEIGHSKGATANDHLKMRMNIEMYEHTLLPALRTIEEQLAQTNKVRAGLRDCYEQTGQASEFEAIFRDHILSFGRAGDVLKEKIIRRGAEIAAERGLMVRAMCRPIGWASRWRRVNAA